MLRCGAQARLRLESSSPVRLKVVTNRQTDRQTHVQKALALSTDAPAAPTDLTSTYVRVSMNSFGPVLGRSGTVPQTLHTIVHPKRWSNVAGSPPSSLQASLLYCNSIFEGFGLQMGSVGLLTHAVVTHAQRLPRHLGN